MPLHVRKWGESCPTTFGAGFGGSGWLAAIRFTGKAPPSVRGDCSTKDP